MDECERLELELARERQRSQRLRAVAETAALINSTLDLRELAEHILDAATGLIGADRGSLFLVEGDRLRSLVARGLDDAPLVLAIGEGIVGIVAATGEAVILNDPYQDPRFDPSVDRVTGYRTRSLLTVPVRDRDGVLIAVLQLLNHASGSFSSDDVDFLAELGVSFAVALTTARMHTEIVSRERMREELRLAADIQRQLQPEHGTVVPGLELKSVVRPCREVGGDYWDLIPSDVNDRWWLVLADISGKGVAAGLIASNVQAFLWSRRSDRRALERIVSESSDLLYRLARGRKFATLAVVEWHPATRIVRWVNAGHPPVYVRRGGTVHELHATGRPVGMLPDQDYESGEMRVAPGDLLLLYTDGVFEAGATSSGGEFGFERIRACLDGSTSCSEVTSRLEEALAAHLGSGVPDDDITMVCAGCVDRPTGG